MHLGLRDLRQAHASLAARAGALSPERRRQYVAVLGELERAAAAGDLPADPHAPIGTALLDTFLENAEAGRYRATTTATGPTSASTNRVRIGCLNRLSEQAGHPYGLRHRTPAPPPKPGTSTREAAALRGYLRAQNRRPLLDDGHARILAAIGICLDTGGRSGELAAIRLADLTPGLRAVRLRPNPQRLAGPGTGPGEPIRLSAATRDALARYLLVRERLVAALRAWYALHPDQGVDPNHDFLFVSLLPNHTGRPSVEGGTPLRPEGVPLHPQGLRRALDRAALRINAGRPRARPLPTMEQLRRIIDGPPGAG
ncbi:hypothetical protein GCM10018781_73940 [Kitasatospora indigofera]|uniref:Uncharacterized protein n=1 Tax=Kitasatospora indigofera TaxID=67307 RepID=A0A919L5T7_9ACTN|nr:hypothetical protein [Kitasatospora indigofera]GHH84519.1 hypothetical protein GCM10018781_73940 [Kitasatospora indigofera]